MRLKTLAVVTAAGIALTACGKKADQAEGTNTLQGNVDTSSGSAVTNADENSAATAPVSGGQQFANTAAASDAFEIQSSQLAQQTSKSAAIKKFAQAMIDAHQQSTDKLKAAASSATPAITPDPTLPADMQQKLDTLKSKTGTDFDREYASMQVGAHQQTLSTLQSYAQSGEVPELKKFADNMVPKVTAHLNMAKGLKP